MTRQDESTYFILSSGVALGVYVPALVLAKHLNQKGKKTEILTLEELFLKEKKENILRNKFEFHRNFRLALAGQKISNNLYDSFSEESVNSLFNSWAQTENKKLVVMSGFWMPLVEKFKSVHGLETDNVKLVHLDADLSASWQKNISDEMEYENLWFFEHKTPKINYYLPINGSTTIPYNERNNRLVVHGGGWGIGNYKEAIAPLLENSGFHLDIVAYEPNDIEDSENCDYHLIDPNWKTWERENNAYIFPPLVDKKTLLRFPWANTYPQTFDYIKNSKAIISKPGGGTILDSLASATPIVYMKPFGGYEKKNYEMLEELKVAISFEEWLNSGFNLDTLERLHNNILGIKKDIKNIITKLL